MIRLALLATSLAALSALAASPGLSAPLEVRAAATLEATPLRTGPTWLVRFVLRRDDAEPIALAPLEVRVDGAPAVTAITDADGAVLIPLAGTTAGHLLPWTVRLAGTPTLAGAEFAGRVDLRRVPTRLSIAAAPASPLTLTSGRATVHLALTASDEDRTPLRDATLRLRLGDGPFRSARTGPDGTLAFVIDPALLPVGGERQGPLRVEAGFDGDAMFGPSSATAALPRALLSRISLRVAREGDTGSGRLRFSGRVAHELGAHPGALVRIELTDDTGDKRLSFPALSDGDGIWNAGVPLETLREAGIARAVVTAWSAPSMEVVPARSRELRIEVPAAPGRSALLPLAALAALLGLYAWLGRGRARDAVGGLRQLAGAILRAVRSGAASLQRLARRAIDRLGPRGRTRAPEPAWPAEVFVAGSPHAGDRHRIRLAFVDRDTGAGVRATATLFATDGEPLATGEGEGVTLTAASGEDLRLVVSGPGLIPVELRTHIPHDGAFDGATVRVRRVARRLRELHEGVARRLGDEPSWGRDTPREVARRLAARSRLPGGQGAFEALVRAVEAAYFGPHPPDASTLATLEALVGEPEPRPPRRSP